MEEAQRQEYQQEKAQERQFAELKQRAARNLGPKMSFPAETTLSEASNALKSVMPHLSRQQRRDMVKNSKSKGKGFTK